MTPISAKTPIIFTIFACLANAASILTLKFSAPFNVPNDASPVVQHDHASFSWPAHWFADFAGNATHPNLFTKDILDLLANKSGAQPFIRVGGTSTDRVWYNASQAEGLVAEYDGAGLTGSLGIASLVSIGDAFFDGFRNFPSTTWSWQINMGKFHGQPGAKANAMEVAKAVMESTEGRLESFEIGNEPDIFDLVGHRPEGYTMEQYVAEWNEYADAAVEEVLRGNSYGLPTARCFQGCVFSGAVKNWTVQKAFDLGLDERGHVGSVAVHHYDGFGEHWITLGQSLMSHDNIIANVSSLAPDIAAAHRHNVPYILGETNSDASNLNFTQVIGVFGSALWQVDRIFASMAAGVKRSNFIQGTTFGYTAWVPVSRDGREPYVRPPLYAQIMAADALGHDEDVRVYPLRDSKDKLSAYAIYGGTRLNKYVLNNLEEWNSTSSYPRPSRKVELRLPKAVKGAKVERLTAPGASADADVQWAGLSWNYTDGRLAESGQYVVENLEPIGCSVLVDLPATEAALVTLSY